jgi:hypothetical protein
VDWIDLAPDRDRNKRNSIVVAAFCKILGPSGKQEPLTQCPGYICLPGFPARLNTPCCFYCKVGMLHRVGYSVTLITLIIITVTVTLLTNYYFISYNFKEHNAYKSIPT